MCERCEALKRASKGKGTAGLMAAMLGMGGGMPFDMPGMENMDDLLGMPGMGSIKDLERMFNVTSAPKTVREIELEAEMSGKDSQIKHLKGFIGKFHTAVADLTKKVEEKDAEISSLRSDLDDMQSTVRMQASALESNKARIAKLTEGKDACTERLTVIGGLLSKIEATPKTSKADLLKLVASLKAAL